MNQRDNKFPMLLLLFMLAMIPAASGSEASKDSREQSYEPALVSAFNRPVAVLRSPSFGYTPAQRAKSITERIDALIDKGIYGPVASEIRTEGSLITIGGHLALTIQSGDLDLLAGKNLEETVQEAMRQLTAALEEARLQHSTPYILRASAKSAGATVALILVLVLIGGLYRRAMPRILNLEQRLTERAASRGFFYLGHIIRLFRWVIRLSVWILILGITFQWLSNCLQWFPYTKPWGERLQQNLMQLMGVVFSAILRTLPDLAMIVVIVVIARGVAGIVKGFFGGVESGKIKAPWIEVQAARATSRLVTIIIWLFAVVMIYPYIPGSNSDAFKGVSVFIGVLVSLGSSSVIGQFTSGLVLMYSRALKPGEYVEIGEHEGTVQSLGFLSTKIRSPKNEEFHVPNTVILGTTIKNYTRLAEKGGLLVYTTVTIGYDAPWRQVHAMLIEAAKQTPGLCPEPAPFVLQTALSDFYVEYQLNACLANPPDRKSVLATLHANIQDQFNACGVQIMSPHYLQDKDRPVVVPRENWFAPPAVRESPPGDPGEQGTG